jgi:VIT1/CCC1 family predicted Fe2+/Mn2+ transporter
MDTEEEINNAAEKLMKDITVSKLDSLNMLLGRYQSQKRLEEAVIVQKIIEKEKSKPENYGHGLHQDM